MGKDILAAESFRNAFLSSLNNPSLSKDRCNLGYLGPCIHLLRKHGAYSEIMACARRIQIELSEAGHEDLIDHFRRIRLDAHYLQLIHAHKYLKAGGLYMWKLSCNYGSSYFRWAIGLLILTALWTLLAIPAVSPFFEWIQTDFPVNNPASFAVQYCHNIRTFMIGDITYQALTIPGEILITFLHAIGFTWFVILIAMIDTRVQGI